VESSAQCSTDGGTYQGNGTPCSPNPCLVTGACCVSGSCSVQTLADCNSAGGHYLGDYSTCLGVDCVHGACCHGSTCTITTPAECLYTYMGDGTTCDPNPCYIVSECCAGGFLVGGIRYLSKTVCVIGNASYDWCAGAPCDGNCNFCSTVDIDPVTCAHTTSCDGSSFVEADGFAESLTWLLRSNGHCGWSESNFSSTGNVGLCGECDPGCPIESGYLEDFTTPCSNLCTDSNIGGEPCPPVGCCGTRGFQVTIDYSNPCSSP
jgi:hypothetical protein